MDRRTRESLDRHITGNYGENQFRGMSDEEAFDGRDEFIRKDLIETVLTDLMRHDPHWDRFELVAALVEALDRFGPHSNCFSCGAASNPQGTRS